WYRWSEGRTPFHLWDGFKRRLLIQFQQSQEGNLYEQFLAITQEESARAYVALFAKLACQLVRIPKSVMEATFIKGLKPALRATVRVMNPDGLNNAMELAVSIENNQLYEGVMCEEKYTLGHRYASCTLQVILVDESDEAEEPNLNFKSWARGKKGRKSSFDETTLYIEAAGGVKRRNLYGARSKSVDSIKDIDSGNKTTGITKVNDEWEKKNMKMERKISKLNKTLEIVCNRFNITLPDCDSGSENIDEEMLIKVPILVTPEQVKEMKVTMIAS
ncbi:ankyrin repeat-containing protein, partial [Tanacetum coccineum]